MSVIPHALANDAKRGWRGLLDLLLPPLCIGCREPVREPGSYCSACWQKIEFLDGPCCDCCGAPFEWDVPRGTLCAACLAERPSFDRARAVMRYTDASKGAILALKHGDRLDLVPSFGLWLARAGHELLSSSDAVVGVPLHPIRLWTRRYNQSSELARAVARPDGKSVLTGALIRTRATPSQGEMPSAKARRTNVRGAFRVPRESIASIKGQSVLLVDDVLTTGATVNACARALKRAGAAKVQVLALARVVRPAEAVI